MFRGSPLWWVGVVFGCEEGELEGEVRRCWWVVFMSEWLFGRGLLGDR